MLQWGATLVASCLGPLVVLKAFQNGTYSYKSKSVFRIRRVTDNKGITSHISPYKHSCNPLLELSHRDGSKEMSQLIFVVKQEK